MAIKALEILNQNNYFYETKLNQGMVIDHYSSEKNRNQNSFFISNLPKFDALMTSIGGWHGLSRDDRRLYFSSYNKFFLPIYYDGKIVGETTSGNYSFIYNKNMAFGYFKLAFNNFKLSN